MNDWITIPVKNCVRCGKDHLKVDFFTFERPPVDESDTIWSHWGQCPHTNEPILMRYAEKTEKTPDEEASPAAA